MIDDKSFIYIYIIHFVDINVDGQIDSMIYVWIARTAVARLASNASLGVHFEEARPCSTGKGFGEMIVSSIYM